MYSVLLAAIDGSPRSRGIFSAALQIANRFDARVHLYRAVSLPADFPAAAHMPPDLLPAFLENEACEFLATLAGDQLRVHCEPPELTTVQPWRAIIAFAAKIRADLIVIGSHGHSGWDRVLGTNASKVVDHADRNVLVVHEREQA